MLIEDAIEYIPYFCVKKKKILCEILFEIMILSRNSSLKFAHLLYA